MLNLKPLSAQHVINLCRLGGKGGGGLPLTNKAQIFLLHDIVLVFAGEVS